MYYYLHLVVFQRYSVLFLLLFEQMNWINNTKSVHVLSTVTADTLGGMCRSQHRVDTHVHMPLVPSARSHQRPCHMMCVGGRLPSPGRSQGHILSESLVPGEWPVCADTQDTLPARQGVQEHNETVNWSDTPSALRFSSFASRYSKTEMNTLNSVGSERGHRQSIQTSDDAEVKQKLSIWTPGCTRHVLCRSHVSPPYDVTTV